MLNQIQMMTLIQACIGPVILISGAGLILLSMTNRYNHLIDRTRQLIESMSITHDPQRRRYESHPKIQIKILLKRAKLVRLSITFIVLTIILAILLILILFITSLFDINSVYFISGVLIGCLLCFVVSLLAFLFDIQESLTALKLEAKEVLIEPNCHA